MSLMVVAVDRDSLDGIATRYGLVGPGIESLCWRHFLTHPDPPWSPPSLLYSGYRLTFPEVNRPGRGINHPLPSSAEVKERVELFIYYPFGTSSPGLGRIFTL